MLGFGGEVVEFGGFGVEKRSYMRLFFRVLGSSKGMLPISLMFEMGATVEP